MQTFFLAIIIIVLLGTAWHVIKSFPDDAFSIFTTPVSLGVSQNGADDRRVASDVVSANEPHVISRSAVRIYSVDPSSQSDTPSISLSVSGANNSTVNLTGWSIRSRVGIFVIPQIAQVYDPHRRTTFYDLQVHPGDKINIYFRNGPAIGYRVNTCMGSDNSFSQDYERCIVDYQGSSGFLRDEVRIYTGLQGMINAQHDRIQLFDENGSIVDEYFY